MDYLSDVAVCVRELSSEKATDRKKSVEKLKQLIQKGSVITNLDKNSDKKLAGKKERMFSWDDIVKGVFYYISIETDALCKGKEAHTAATKANREKKKQEISGTLKLVIKQADKRGARLRCSPILDHIKESLLDEYMCTAFGLDYSNILLKSLLSSRKYWTEIATNTWLEFVSLYCKLYTSEDCMLDRVLLSRVIQSLILGASKQCDIRPKRLLTFYTDVFKNIRQEKSNTVVENLLKGMNVFVKNIAENARVQICKMGEEVFVSLLYVWNSRPSLTLKEEVIEFLGLQIQAHHPHGARREEPGAYAFDWDSWMSSLRKLYEVVYTDMQEMRGRSRFSGGAQGTSLSDTYVELVADLCNQLFSSDTNSIEVTQIADNTQEGRSVKKRRLESGWSAVLDVLTTAGHAPYVIPWLQLVTKIVQKYPQNFPADTLYSYLDVLAKLLTEFKKNDVMQYVFACIQAFIENWECIPQSAPETCLPLINQIWNAALRTIYFHHAESAAFHLVSSAIQKRLIEPSTDVWSIFLPSVGSPNNHSIIFLLTFLQNCLLPENHRADFLSASTKESSKGQYALRKQLFDWMLLDRERACENFQVKISENLDPELRGRMLVSLLLKSPWKQLPEQKDSKDLEEESSSLQHLYSETCLQFKTGNAKKNWKKGMSSVSSESIVPMMMKHLECKFKEEVMILMDVIEVESCHLETLCWEVCVLGTMLHHMVEWGVVTTENLQTLELVTMLKALMKKMGNFMESVLTKESSLSLCKSLSWLRRALHVGECDNQGEIVVGRLLRSLFPAKVLDILLGIVKDKGKGKSRKDASEFSLSRGSQSGSKRRRIDDDLDDMDIEFDSPPAQDQGEDVDDFDDDIAESQELDSTNQEVQEYCSITSPLLLTEHQRLRQDAVHVLALWCGYDTIDDKQMARYDMALDGSFVKSKLVHIFQEENFDTSKVADLQLMKILVETLSNKHHNISNESLLTIITAIRFVAKDHRHDQTACCMCVDLLTLLIPRLKNDDEMVPAVLQECRQSALMLLSAFCNCVLEHSSFKYVQCTCISSLMYFQCDPNESWATLSVKRDGEKISSPVNIELLRPLSDLSLTVRLSSAHAITKLFNCDGVPVDRGDQDKMFDKIYEEIMEALDIQGNLSAERLNDERNNRTTSSLCTIGNIICVSPTCEKKALFAMCQLIRERGVEVERVLKVVERLSDRQSFKDGRLYMTCHLPYLIHQWLSLSYPVMEFPYQLLLCNSHVEFFRNHHQVLIPELMMMKDVNSAKEVVQTMQEDWGTVLKRCIPSIMVHILPLFAATGEAAEDRNVKRRTAHASVIYDLLATEVTKEVVERCISSSLDVIVVKILRCMYDPDEDEFVKTGHIKDLDPEPNPPCFNTYITQSTINYLSKSFSGSNRSLVEVLSKTQDSIQNILLDLATDLVREHRLHEKRRVLLMYRLFSKMLLKEFSSQLGAARDYVLREIVHRLMYLIKAMIKLDKEGSDNDDYISNIGCMALELLKEACYVGTEVYVKEIQKYLMLMVSGLTSVVQHGGVMAAEAMDILKMLIIDSNEGLIDTIVLLDPFPQTEEFHTLSAVYNRLKSTSTEVSLRQHVQDFILSTEKNWVSVDERKEGLSHLSRMLAEKGTEMKDLIEECRVKGSSSLLGKFVSQLVHMSRSASNSEVKVILATCLGQIGPVDLAMLSLPQLNSKLGKKIDVDVKLRNHGVIVKELTQYLISEDMELVRATSNVLKSTLSTSSGIRFIAHCRADKEEDMLQYLYPFIPKKKSGVSSQDSSNQNDDLFTSLVDQSDLWMPAKCGHKEWIQNLTCTIITSGGLKDELLSLLEPVCTLKVGFCELILPFLIHNIVLDGDPSYREILSRHFCQFFLQHCSAISGGRYPTSVNNCENKNICMNKDSLRTMLNVVHYLRQQDRPKEGRKNTTVWDNNFWLDLNYLHISKVALYCSAYFSAVMYAEIWCNSERLKTEADMKKKNSQGSQGHGQGHSQVVEQFSQDTPIESLSSNSEGVEVNVQDLLLEAYRQTGDPDGVYGCGAGRLADTTSRLKTYEHECKWDKAALTYDIERSLGGVDIGMLQAIQKLGTRDWLQRCLQDVGSKPGSNPEIREIQYQAAWHSAQWDMENNASTSKGASFHENVYTALSSVRDRQPMNAVSAINSAKLCVLDGLGETTIESCRSLYPLLSNLQCVSQIDHVLQGDLSNSLVLDELNERWMEESLAIYTDFDYIEPTYQIRCAVLKILGGICEDHVGAQTGLQHQLMTLVKEAVGAKKHQVAERALFELMSHVTTDLKVEIPKLIEQAKFYWTRQEPNIAKHLMKNLIGRLEKNESLDAARLYPLALSIYGSWLAETHSENHNIILEQYLEKTVSLMESLEFDGDSCLDAYLSLARFCDGQYQNIVNYMKSSTFEAKQGLMKKAQDEMEKMRVLSEEELLKDRYYRTLLLQSNIDQSEMDSMERDRVKFLMTALENYLKCLRYGDKHDLRMFRMTSMWFSNSAMKEVNNLMKSYIEEIKSYKFLPLMYQLCARMDTKVTSDQSPVFQEVLNKVIERAARGHPHHTLNCILALAHAKKDEEIFKQPSTATKKSGRLARSNSDAKKDDEGRIEAAKNMVQRLKSPNSGVAAIVKDMETLCIAYIQLANIGVSQHKTNTKPIPLDKRLLITQIKDLNNVAMPTVNIQVDPSCRYDYLVTLKGFEPTFKLAGGINLPKIITCVGSDGVGRRQLVKGRDDLRQDAVMQQFFSMMNNLLTKDQETRKRQLQVRQYKVIPLSKCSGLLEWCEGTLPIGQYLIGGGDESKGAHKRYRPYDISFLECRKAIGQCASSPRTDASKKLKVFLEVCSKFQPVFRYFFMEHFPEPAEWFEKRLIYTKSVATTSIVGYILGLGDRHVQNILVDVNTAEFVHIDLGVAFEQGRILPTPETVPFRLTRDIVDGMGVSGVEGVFRRCCEKTMEVMHQNQEALLTILEVLLYDPLNNWTMSPHKAVKIQAHRDRADESEMNTTTDILDITNGASSPGSPAIVNPSPLTASGLIVPTQMELSTPYKIFLENTITLN
ncbi:hypothetical protein FSP39_020638 [Pinctada imbricata]|uniref:Non-specific serine/threonine protein kinase n=1 Tax=Pinctada imbricata TaxID=66713 RepID=A0AA88YBB2_PINIB|nr:hypothetical protein FSP39_020638 [Pinctada imbricata]